MDLGQAPARRRGAAPGELPGGAGLVGAGVASFYNTRLEAKNVQLAEASAQTDRALMKAKQALDEAEFQR